MSAGVSVLHLNGMVWLGFGISFLGCFGGHDRRHGWVRKEGEFVGKGVDVDATNGVAGMDREGVEWW